MWAISRIGAADRREPPDRKGRRLDPASAYPDPTEAIPAPVAGPPVRGAQPLWRRRSPLSPWWRHRRPAMRWRWRTARARTGRRRRRKTAGARARWGRRRTTRTRTGWRLSHGTQRKHQSCEARHQHRSATAHCASSGQLGGAHLSGGPIAWQHRLRGARRGCANVVCVYQTRRLQSLSFRLNRTCHARLSPPARATCRSDHQRVPWQARHHAPGGGGGLASLGIRAPPPPALCDGSGCGPRLGSRCRGYDRRTAAKPQFPGPVARLGG
jgi:hypothetical protein